MPTASLIKRILARVAGNRPNDEPGMWLAVQPPVGTADLKAAEKQLGFPLPDLLRQLYLEVGNGGFGPVFGLVPLSRQSLGDDPPVEAEVDLVTDYLRIQQCYADAPQHWPRGLVPTFYCGATVLEFVDCNTGRMTWFDEGTEGLADLLNDPARWPPRLTLEDRLKAWLSGRRVW